MTAPATDPYRETAPPAAATGSVWEDMIDIFYAPSPVFDRRRDGRFGIQLLVLVVLTMVLYFATKPYLTPMYDAIWAQAAEGIRKGNPNISDEQLSKMGEMGDKFGVVSMALGMPLVVLSIGVVIWLLTKVFDAKLGFSQAMVVATLSQFPKLVDFVVMGVQGFFMDPSRITSMHSLKLSAARFMSGPDVSLVAQSIASRFDLFIIWSTVLIAIGVYVISKSEKSKGAIIAAIVWVVGTLPVAYQAMKQG